MIKVRAITTQMKKLGIQNGTELARRANIPRQTVWNLLNERHTPETRTLLAVAAALNMPLSSIIDEKAAV